MDAISVSMNTWFHYSTRSGCAKGGSPAVVGVQRVTDGRKYLRASDAQPFRFKCHQGVAMRVSLSGQRRGVLQRASRRFPVRTMDWGDVQLNR